jgi:hypothetical protein
MNKPAPELFRTPPPCPINKNLIAVKFSEHVLNAHTGSIPGGPEFSDCRQPTGKRDRARHPSDLALPEPTDR